MLAFCSGNRIIMCTYSDSSTLIKTSLHPIQSEILEFLLRMNDSDIENCIKDSTLLHTSKYAKLKVLIEAYGGKVPPLPPTVKEEEEEGKTSDDVVKDEGLIESPDSPPYPEIPEVDGDVEPDYAKAGEFKAQARKFESEKKFTEALKAYTECIKANPRSGLTIARRAGCLLELGRPNAAINDCNAALKINPDSSRSKKIRGHAYRLLGQYEKALKDLSEANRYDFDPKTDKLLKVVQEYVKQIKSERNKKQREREEKEQEKKRQQSSNSSSSSSSSSSMPGMSGMPGMGGMPSGGMGGMAGMMAQLFGNDPEMKDLLQKPKVMNAFQKMLSNPMGAMSDPLMKDPEVTAAMAKLMPKLQGLMGGMPGMSGMPGMGMGGMGGNAKDDDGGMPDLEPMDGDDDDLD
jgi:suppressor of tumorigenicity protein 13